MSSMFVPEPVISYAIKPTDQKKLTNFSKALNRCVLRECTRYAHSYLIMPAAVNRQRSPLCSAAIII